MERLVRVKVSQKRTHTAMYYSKREHTGKGAAVKVPFSTLWETAAGNFQPEVSVLESLRTSYSGLPERRNAVCPVIILKGTL